MPVVPIPQRQVGTEPLPTVRVPTDAPAAAFSGALNAHVDFSGVRSVVDRLHEEAVARNDQVRVLDADNQLADLETQQRAAFAALRGSRALGAVAQVRNAFRTRASEIEAGLTSEQQRLVFRSRAALRWDALNGAVNQHVTNELQQLDDKTTESALNNRVDDAAAHPMDAARITRNAQEMRAIIGDYAQARGWSPEITQAAQAGRLAQLHTGVISGLLGQGADLAARDYFDRTKDQIAGTEQAKLAQMVRAGSIRGESQRQFDQIMQRATTQTDAIAAARQLADPDVRDATEQRVRAEFAERAQAAQAQRDGAFLDATNIIERTHAKDAIPAAAWASFTIAERNQLDDYLQKQIKGVPIATNYGWLNDQMALASSPTTRADFLNTPYATMRANLSDSDLKDMIQLRSSVAKGNAEADEHIAGYRQVAEVVDGTLRSAGYDLNTKDAKKLAEIESFRRVVNLGVSSLRAANGGKPLSAGDIQGLVDDSFLKLHNAKGKEARVFQREPGDQLVFTVSDIPPLRVNQIKAALATQGLPITDRNIMRLYDQYFLSRIPAATVPQP